MPLPIDEIRSEFDAALGTSNRLVVTAETGAGKSTRLPIWLSEQVDGLVMVVEPRRVACHALADFLASERGERVGQFFGSSVRFSHRSSPETRVLFCTPGVALRMLADAQATFGAIVVDEFHERSWQMDLLVTAASTLERFRTVPLVITSATIDAEDAASKLGASRLHATGRTFGVTVRYSGDVVEPTTERLAERVRRALLDALERHEGDALVFLPGMREIRAAEAALGRRDEEVLVVHGGQPPEAMQQVFRSSDRRRIYLATNVAETSITLPGVRIVLDSGLHKTRLHRAGRAALATVPVSAASMEQRAGRAGRVAAGVCVRLWSERYNPAPLGTPEIARTELDDFVLQAAQLGLVGDSLRRATWMTPPPDFALDRAEAHLEELGALDASGLTDRGRQLADLPVSADEAAMLVGAPAKLAGTVCDLVAILQSRGSFLLSTGSLVTAARRDAEEARAQLLRGVTDEVTMNLELLRKGDEQHHLSSKRLEEARAVSKQLREISGATGTSTAGLAAFLLARLPEAGFVLRPRAKRQTRARSQPWANGTIEVDVYPFEPFDPELEMPTPRAAVILDTEWLGSGTSVRGIGRMLLPTNLKTLADAGLGEAELSDVVLDKSKGTRITARREVRLAGVPLASTESPLRGAELHRAVAELVLENRLFKGTTEPLLDALHAWQLLAEWPNIEDLGGATVDKPSHEAPSEWLAQRLADLGLEDASELSLLNRDDLIPTLSDATGVPAWCADPIIDDFPRTWTFQGATYSCAVSPSSGKVTLEPVNAAARKRGEPNVSVIPRFRGFNVVYRQASRTLRLR